MSVTYIISKIWNCRETKYRWEIKSVKLAKRIVDCLSDGYDDEENSKEVERALYNDLSQLKEDSIVKAAILRMCETIEELTE